MTRTVAFSKKELNQVAALATAMNVQVEMERYGTIIRVSPHRPRPTSDETEDAALDMELEAFKVAHGYS